MVKTQVQIPDALYAEAKRIAREREMSFAEVVRRGIEQLVRCYPPLDAPANEWQLPAPISLGVRRDLDSARLRDFIGDEVEDRYLGSGDAPLPVAEEEA